MLRESIAAFILIAICVFIHTTGVVRLALLLVRRRGSMVRRFGTAHNSMVLIGVFGALLLLHLTESCIWGAFYRWRGLFENYETSLYFSLGTYTTLGYGDVLLPQRWRLLGSLEGITGVLLCGLSTAFLFSVVNSLFQFRVQRMGLEPAAANSILSATPTSVETETQRRP
jgi:Ion channel